MLLNFQDSLLRTVKNDFRRYLHSKINWKQRMIGIRWREYLNFTKPYHFQQASFKEIIKNHRELSSKIVEQIHPLPAFKKY